MAKARPAINASLAELVTDVARDSRAPEVVQRVPVGKLRPGAHQPRRTFDEATLRDLAASIKEQGMLQPIVARPSEHGFEIVAGERRWRAATLAGVQDVPVIVRTFDDDQAADVAAIENLQREDLNVVDEVDAVVRVTARVMGWAVADVPRLLAAAERAGSAEELARLDELFSKLGRGAWRSYARNKLPVLNLPPDVLAAARAGLEYSKARVVGAVADEARRADLLELARSGATVEQLRAAVAPPPSEVPEARDRARRIGRVLTSWKRVEALPAAKRTRVERLLQQLEDLLRDDE